MQDAVSPPDVTSPLDPEGRAQIVDRLYEVALDPVRLADLLEVWEGHVAPHRADRAIPLEDAEIEAHLARATVFLDRMEMTGQQGGRRGILEQIPRSAAFLSDGGPLIEAFNRPAAIAFGLAEGARLADLPFEPEDTELLRAQIRKVAGGQAEKVVMLRIRSRVTGGPVIVRVGAVESDREKPLALVISTELVWPEGFARTVQEAFGLTAAEV